MDHTAAICWRTAFRTSTPAATRPRWRRDLHAGILRDVFHAPGGGTLTVQLSRRRRANWRSKSVREEFGVVNVGDPVAVADGCAEHGVVRLEDDLGRDSLFKGIGRDDSPLTFSWIAQVHGRVGTLGVFVDWPNADGENEGTQIIQLFGRGVRCVDTG
jgi:hypothetical protein